MWTSVRSRGLEFHLSCEDNIEFRVGDIGRGDISALGLAQAEKFVEIVIG